MTYYSGPVAAPSTYQKPAPVDGSVFDDFDGPQGSPPNPDLWTPIAGSDWGLGVSDPANVYLDGQGNLVLSAIKNPDGSWSTSQVGIFNNPLGYGTFLASIKMAPGKGIHPSFWLLGETYDWQNDANWPACGEIDIFETIFDGNYYCTVHGPMSGSAGYNQAQIGGPLGFHPADDFHLYWCKHQPGKVTFGLNATIVGTVTPASIPSGAHWAVDQPMDVLFSVAVGSSSTWGGGPNSDTLPQVEMLVDWFYWHP